MTEQPGFIGSIGKQSGAVMLALMLVLLTGSSYLLLTNFNANSIKVSSATKTSKALKSAKQSLLSYAVSYPDLGNDGGPGYLPCPDITNDGIAGGNCSYAGGTTIGYFPFKTLDTQELRDGNGQRLWYVISERYRYGSNKTEPMNSDIADDSVNNLDLNIDNNPTASTDNIDNIVAIIIAPGVPLSGQTRTGDASDAENLNPDNYLEGENADGDQIYMTIRSVLRNDRLVLITRNELMAAVERRAMGDIATALQRYRATYNALRWLSPFADPAASTFHSEAGANGYRDHLPFHWSEDTPGSTNRNPFSSDISIAWENIQNAQITDNPDNSGNVPLPMPTIECLINTKCIDTDDPLEGQVPHQNEAMNASCIWTNREDFDCTGSFTKGDDNILIFAASMTIYGYKYNSERGWVYFYTDTSGSYRWELAHIDQYGTGWGNWMVTPAMQGDITRLYEFDVAYTDGNFNSSTDIVAPDANTSRTRNLEVENELLNANDVTITATDTLTDITFYPDFENEPTTKESDRSLTSDSDTIGTIVATNVKYDLDIDASELPEWFVKNKWNELVYIVYAEGETYPGNTIISDPCADSDVECLNIDYFSQYATANRDNIRALVLMASGTLSGQDRTTWPSSPATMSDYLESGNADADTNYVMKMPDDNFNDSLKVILQK